MRMQKDTLREIIKETLLEILEDDEFLLQPFLERARIDIVKSVSKDIERMIRRRMQMDTRGGGHRSYAPPMYEDDDGGDGDYGWGYDDYDVAFDAIDGGYGDDYGAGGPGGFGNPAPTRSGRKGMARFYEGQGYMPMTDPEMAPHAFGRELAQVRRSIGANRVSAMSAMESESADFGNHQLDEMMGPEPEHGHPDEFDFMESAAMDAVHGEMQDFPHQMDPRAMRMPERYRQAVPQFHPELLKEAKSVTRRAMSPEERIRQAQMAPPTPKVADPMLDRPVADMKDALRARRHLANEKPQGNFGGLGTKVGTVDGDGKPIPTATDPRFGTDPPQTVRHVGKI